MLHTVITRTVYKSVNKSISVAHYGQAVGTRYMNFALQQLVTSRVTKNKQRRWVDSH